MFLNKIIDSADKAFFKFYFSLVAKKLLIYLAVVLYFILIIFYTSVIPKIVKMDPLQMFSLPLSGSFLMFSVILFSSFLAIEIFRTPIDDGTELLIVSKPITRNKIVGIKLLIFLIYIFSISIVTSLLASFSFATKLGTTNDNLLVVFGSGVATLVIGMIFGSVTTLFTLYFKKIVSLLLTLCIGFFLMTYSSLSSYIIKSPIKIMSEANESILPLTLFEPDEKNHKIKISEGATTISTTDTVSNVQPGEIWNKYKTQSKYIINSYLDIAGQLSSFYTLNTPNSSFSNSFKFMSIFNQNVDYKFTDFTSTDLEKIPHLKFIKIPNSINASNGSMNLFNNLFLSKERTSTKFITNNSTIYDVRLALTNSEINTMVVDEKQWDNLWNTPSKKDPSKTFGDDITAESQLQKNKLDITYNIVEEFLRQFFTYKGLNASNKKEVLEELNKLILSAYFKLLKEFKTGDSLFSKTIDFNTDIDNQITLEHVYKNIDDSTDSTANNIKKVIVYLSKNTIQENTLTKTTNLKEGILEKIVPAVNQISIDNKKRAEYRSMLGLLGVNIANYINQQNVTYEKNKKIFGASPATAILSLASSMDTKYSQNNDTNKSSITFAPLFKLVPQFKYSKFQKVEVVPLSNSVALILVWISIAISFFSVSIYLYYRRDFA